MKRVLSLTIILIGTLTQVFAQSTSKFIRGVIQGRETKEPIPFASISITGTTRGTAASANGEFYLLIKPEDSRAHLKISSIGFMTKAFPVDSLKDIALVQLGLQADIKLLKELEVNQKPINPVEIIRSAIDSIAVHYKAEPFNLEFYSEMNASNVITNQEFKIESIILGYYKGYATNAEKKFEILKKRSSGDNPLKTMEYPFWPTLELHRADLISDPARTGILNEKNLDKFEYKYMGVLTYDTDTLYHISYHAPKPTEKITGYGIVPKTYKGNIYISTAGHAIVKHEIETDQFQYTIIYKKMGIMYFPYLVRGERQLKGAGTFTKISNQVSLTNVELENVKVIDYRTNEFQELDKIPDDTEYWIQNHPKEKE